jgi:hypothetical protein
MRTRSTTRSSVRLKGRLVAVTAVACATALSVAPAALGTGASAAKVRQSHSKTVTLQGRTTKTVDVGYPNALKFRGAKYSCTWKVSGVDPRKVKILFHGSVKGGTVCRVKARNPARPSIDASVKLKVTATTVH